jgi:hypothetical protein
MIKSHVLYQLSYGLTCVTSMAYANSALVRVPINPCKKFLRALREWGSNSMMGDDGKRGLRDGTTTCATISNRELGSDDQAARMRSRRQDAVGDGAIQVRHNWP